QQSRDDFAHRAQLLGQRLVCDGQFLAMTQQGEAKRWSRCWKAIASTSEVRSAMRSANSSSTRLRNPGESSQLRNASGGINSSVVGRVVTPLAIMGSVRNRQALDTRHSSPGPTRYNSSARPSGEARETRTSPSSTSGKPLQASCSLNRTAPAGTATACPAAPRAGKPGDTPANAGYSVSGSGMRRVVQPGQIVQDRAVGPLVAVATMDQMLQGPLHRLHGLDAQAQLVGMLLRDAFDIG